MLVLHLASAGLTSTVTSTIVSRNGPQLTTQLPHVVRFNPSPNASQIELPEYETLNESCVPAQERSGARRCC